jgi:hypothetical protein
VVCTAQHGHRDAHHAQGRFLALLLLLLNYNVSRCANPPLPFPLVQDMLNKSKSLFAFVGDFPSGRSSGFVVPKTHSAALNGSRRQPCPPNLVPPGQKSAPVAQPPPLRAPASAPVQQPPQQQQQQRGGHYVASAASPYPPVPQELENKLRKVRAHAGVEARCSQCPPLCVTLRQCTRWRLLVRLLTAPWALDIDDQVVEQHPNGIDAGSFAPFFYSVNRDFVQVRLTLSLPPVAVL